ncbi:MAG: hypothetical protein HUJ76_02765 [Parasporobacterium sp.]|nr:hypothetical protein [Parasporobacterium sp.]
MDLENSKIQLAKAENEMLTDGPGSARKKKRADRKRRRKYKFTDKKHSRPGMISTALAVAAIALVVISIIIAVRMKGQAGEIAGLLPFLSLIMATVGIILPGVTFRRSDTIFTFSWIGLITNIVVWLFVAFILVIGL